MVNKITTPPTPQDVIDTINNIIDDKQDVLTAGNGIDISGGATISCNNTIARVTDIVQSDWNETNTSSKAYILNKPTIPSGVIVDQTYNGTSANAQSGVAIAGAGFLTGITSGMVTTALGYTPYNSTNPSGYQANKIETIKVNGTAQTITSKAVDIIVPTNNNQLANGAGYITASALNGYAKTTDLATVATSGSYDDLDDKPTIPAAQVNSDWNASGGVSQILNKPTIPTVNNATLTIQKNGTNVGTFTANASTDKTINITVPTNTNELTNGAGFIQNIATGTGAISFGNNAVAGTANQSINIGAASEATKNQSIAIGGQAKATALGAIQIGIGTNSTACSLNIGGYKSGATLYNWQLLDCETGLIPDARLSTNIARTSQIPAAQVQADWNVTNTSSMAYIKNKPTIPSAVTESTVSGWGFTKNTGTVTSVNNVSPVSGNVTLSIPTVTDTYSATSNNAMSGKAVASALSGSGFITGITSSDVTTALGYTPYNSTNPSGYQANVIETIKVNGTALTPTSKTVNITVPSAVTESTVSGWGFTKNTGTVTSVNNTQPDANGNVNVTVSGGANIDLSNLSSTGQAVIDNSIKAILELMYPVGAIFIGTTSTCPMAQFFGTWSLVAGDRVLQGSSTKHAANTTISAGLPDITGSMSSLGTFMKGSGNPSASDALSITKGTSDYVGYSKSDGNLITKISFSAKNSNSIYGSSSTVQPPAYVVNVWRRTA